MISAALSQFRADSPCGFIVEGVAAIQEGPKLYWSVNYTASHCSKLTPIWNNSSVLDKAKSWFQSHASRAVTVHRVSYVGISIPSGDFIRYQVLYSVN